jgi:hypothetical protein
MGNLPGDAEAVGDGRHFTTKGARRSADVLSTSAPARHRASRAKHEIGCNLGRGPLRLG